MSDYHPPLASWQFLLDEGGLAKALGKLSTSSALGLEDCQQMLAEAGKLAEFIIAPTYADGDIERARLENGKVRLPASFYGAYKAFREGGWAGMSFPEEWGGMGLPWTLASAVQEMMQSSNLAWALAPLLSISAVEALISHGSEELQQLYLPKLVSGEWTGTMNLTEPQSGSDLGLIRCKATLSEDGETYRLNGQKIFITFGDHDASENIIHLVLARIEGAEAGSAGLSLFLSPKYLPDEQGKPGLANDIQVLKIEEKIGIHGSPTCVMSYGEQGKAKAWIIGKPGQGLPLMFTMMNLARIFVGVQGLAISERATQHALAYAKERKQGSGKDGKTIAIIHHADVRRMVLELQSSNVAMRALLTEIMLAFDMARDEQSANGMDSRDFANRRLNLMVPVLKGWFTDRSVRNCSTALQIFGGAGFIEEAGAGQFYRDARILPIYEGTNGIQGLDLVGRKILRDKGQAVQEYLDELNSLINRLNPMTSPSFVRLRQLLAPAVDQLDEALELLQGDYAKEKDVPGFMATSLLEIFGLVAGAAALTRALLNALDQAGGDEAKLSAQALHHLELALFFAAWELPATAGLLGRIKQAGELTKLAHSMLQNA